MQNYEFYLVPEMISQVFGSIRIIKSSCRGQEVPIMKNCIGLLLCFARAIDYYCCSSLLDGTETDSISAQGTIVASTFSI